MSRRISPVIATVAVAALASVGLAAQQPPRNEPQPAPNPTQQRPATQPRGTTGGGGVSSTDQHFIHEAAVGGMAEVELGKLASEKAESADVKQFGQRMVTDHSKANDQLKSLAADKNIQLPAQLDAKHKATVDRLSKLSGAAFDRAYVQEMVKDHNEDVSEFRKQASSASDADVKAFASKTLPTLQEHDRMIKDISAKMGKGSQ